MSYRVDELLEANKKFAETWPTPPTMKQIRPLPGDTVMVLTCMDPRAVPEQFVGPDPQIGVFRNAGGRFSHDAVRTFNVLRNLRIGSDKVTIMVVHHTDCGMTHMTNDGIRDYTKERVKGGHDILDKTDFGCFAAEDLEKVIREDVQAFRDQEVLEGIEIRGFVLTTETGVLTEVEI